MKTIHVLLLLLFIPFCLQAQNKNTIGVNAIYGSKVFDTKGTYKGLGVSYNISTVNNTSAWIKVLNIESINVEAALYDLGNITASDRMAAFNPRFANKGYFGYDVALGGAVDIRVANIPGVKLLFSPGFGLVYSTKNYTSTHGVNQMLGSHVNAIASAKVKLAIPIANDTRINIGAGVAHISNAGTAAPNNALNRIESFIGITQGLTYASSNMSRFNLNANAFSVEVIAGYTSQVKQGFYQLQGHSLQLDNSYREKTAPIGKASASIAYNHYFNGAFGVKIGTDLVYSAKLSPPGATTTDTTKFLQTFQGNYTPVGSHLNVGINAGIDLCFGRFVFTPAYGYYLGNYEKYVYNKAGSGKGRNEFQYGRQFYTTFSCKYFVTPKIALVAKSYLHSFAGVGVNVGF